VGAPARVRRRGRRGRPGGGYEVWRRCRGPSVGADRRRSEGPVFLDKSARRALCFPSSRGGAHAPRLRAERTLTVESNLYSLLLPLWGVAFVAGFIMTACH